MSTLLDNVTALYFAVNGWGDAIKCQYVDDKMQTCGSPDVVGIADDDGSPCCERHLNCEDSTGQRFAPGVLKRLKAQRLANYKEAGEEPTE